MDSILQNRKDLDPSKPLIIKDDSQVIKIIAKKIKGEPHYLVKISHEEVKL